MAPPTMVSAILIFAGTYFVLAIGRLPGFRVDRTGAAIIGATLMVTLNVLTIPEAIKAVNTDTTILLFGMMIVVANLRLSGFFALITEWVVRHAGTQSESASGNTHACVCRLPYSPSPLASFFFISEFLLFT